MSYIFMLLILLSPSLGTPRRQPAPTPQKAYCERSFTNFAWGYQHKGIYIDPEGNLYSYSYQPKDKPWSPKQDDAPTAAELEDKYSHGRKLLRKLEPEEWQAKRKLLAAASKGEMSKRKQSGADMGSQVCRCYVADATGQQYKQIELRVQGDWSYENLAPSAKMLADWLESLSASAEKK
ncbi:MAG TPA: hypothetical protein VFZ34_17635 [Blastocatellia bacterium]|nr:hypothetical protein [Blastocatellia bacterium]